MYIYIYNKNILYNYFIISLQFLYLNTMFYNNQCATPY